MVIRILYAFFYSFDLGKSSNVVTKVFQKTDNQKTDFHLKSFSQNHRTCMQVAASPLCLSFGSVVKIFRCTFKRNSKILLFELFGPTLQRQCLKTALS